MRADDVGGVHVKYLHHCRRQLWLFSRGVRPEHLSSLVQLGEAVHDTSYTRRAPVDLGAARLDYMDGQAWVHEVKSSRRPTEADEAQAMHYCYLLHQVGVPAQGAVLHYPATRRTQRIAYDADRATAAAHGVTEVLQVIHQDTPPDRIPRSRCRGCSFYDYCWTE